MIWRSSLPMHIFEAIRDVRSAFQGVSSLCPVTAAASLLKDSFVISASKRPTCRDQNWDLLQGVTGQRDQRTAENSPRFSLATAMPPNNRRPGARAQQFTPAV